MRRPRRRAGPGAERGSGRPANKLSSAQVDALHGVYLCGTAELGRPWSLPEIAAGWWLPLGYSTPKAAAEGIRKEFKQRGLTLRSPSEAAALAAQARGIRPPPPSELTDWLERRRRLTLIGLEHRRKWKRPIGRADRWSLFGADSANDSRQTLKPHFGGNHWEAFSITVELAALAAEDSHQAAPHIAALGASKREHFGLEDDWAELEARGAT